MTQSTTEKKARPTNKKRQVDQARQSNNQTISDYQSHIKCNGENIDAGPGAGVRSALFSGIDIHGDHAEVHAGDVAIMHIYHDDTCPALDGRNYCTCSRPEIRIEIVSKKGEVRS